MKRLTVVWLFFWLALLSLAWISAHADPLRCRRGEYPLMQLQVFACSRRAHKPAEIVLDAQNYLRLKGEFERCIGHPIPAGEVLRLCGIPVVPAPVKKGKEVST